MKLTTAQTVKKLKGKYLSMINILLPLSLKSQQQVVMTKDQNKEIQQPKMILLVPYKRLDEKKNINKKFTLN